MIKTIISILSLFLLFLNGYSQSTTSVDTLVAKQRFKLNNYKANGISNDSTINNKRPDFLVTEQAAKAFAERAYTGVQQGIDSTFFVVKSLDGTINDTIRFSGATVGGSGGGGSGVSIDTTPLSNQLIQLRSGKQDNLVSGTNIKTINSTSLLGSGDITTPVQVNLLAGTNVTISGSYPNLTISSSSVGTVTDTTPIHNQLIQLRSGKQDLFGYTPYNAINPSGYISGITSSNVVTALGFTPYSNTNPNGYISSFTDVNWNGGSAGLNAATGRTSLGLSNGALWDSTTLAPRLTNILNVANAKQNPIILTTIGTSGAATLVGSTINIPNYATGGGGVTSLAGTANQIIVSGSTGAVTLSAPQNIDATASPSFSRLYLTGLSVSTNATDSALVVDATTGLVKKVGASILNSDTLKAMIAIGSVVAQGRITSQTAGANIFTYTVPNDGHLRQYNINSNVVVNSIATDVISCDVVYFNENNVSQTYTIDGTISASGTNPRTVKTIIPYGGTVVTVKITLVTGGGSVNYNASGSLESKAIF